MIKCSLYYTILVFSITIAVVSCGDKKSEEKIEEDANMKVAVTPTLDCLPIIVAVDRGWAEMQKVPFDINVFQAHESCDTALLGGSVVAGFTDNVRAKRINDKGGSLILLRNDNLSWQLVASGAQRVTEIKQLKDKMIAMTRLSATEQLSEHVMDEAKLSAQQTFLVPVNSLAIRLKMLLSNEMDAAWLPQPQAGIALTVGGKLLTKSETQGLTIYGVVAFSTKNKKHALTENQRDVFVKLYNQACDSLNQRGLNSYSEIITRRLGITDKDIKAMGKQVFRHL